MRHLFFLFLLGLTFQNAMASSVTEETLINCNQFIQKNNLKKGYLFSALPFDNTNIGKKWAQIRAEAEVLFPNLKIKKTPDLHITLVYIGDWDLKNYNQYERTALVAPSEDQTLHLEPVQMGRNKQVIALELHGISNNWTQKVVKAKDDLNKLNLKKVDSYDSNFRAHITLAEAKSKTPTETELKELEEFNKWISSKLSESDLTVVINSENKPQLLLAGSSHPRTNADYVEVSVFLNSLAK